MATAAAIAAALATRLRFIAFAFLGGFLLTVLVSDYPGNAQTNPATPPNEVAFGLTTRRYGVGALAAARKSSTGLTRRGWRCGTSGALRQVSRHTAAAPG
jgi:hypothetical protein